MPILGCPQQLANAQAEIVALNTEIALLQAQLVITTSTAKALAILAKESNNLLIQLRVDTIRNSPIVCKHIDEVITRSNLLYTQLPTTY